jgi:DNA-binding NarL/FixJ family response regulator
MPQIGLVNVAQDIPSVLAADPGLNPALVLMDDDRDQVWLTVRRAKARWPQARTIVLVSSVQQGAEAEAAGADVVLLQGFQAGRLVAAIVKLLPQPTL